MNRGFVLVTGATGFLGKQLCPALLRKGYRVRATYRGPIGAGFSENGGVEWVSAGCIDRETIWDGILKGGISHVVHLAAVAHRVGPKAQVPDSVYDEVNHLATVALAQAVARTSSIGRFIFISSIGAVTSLSDVPVTSATSCHPDSAYGASKLAAELGIQNAFGNAATEWCILRPPLLYGPGNPGNMARLLSLLKLHIPLPFGSIRNRRTFLYVGNLVDAILVALEHRGAVRNVFCIGDIPDLSTPDLMRALGNAAGEQVRLLPFPIPALRLVGRLGGFVTRVTGRSMGFDEQAIDKLCGSLPVDSSRFRKMCDWCPPFSMQHGLQTTVAAPSSCKDLPTGSS